MMEFLYGIAPFMGWVGFGVFSGIIVTTIAGPSPDLLDIDREMVGGGPEKWTRFEAAFVGKHNPEGFGFPSIRLWAAWKKAEPDMRRFWTEAGEHLYPECVVDDWRMVELAVKWEIDPEIVWEEALKKGFMW